jgi:hypothetical protein
MKKFRLSAAQVRVLRALAEPGVKFEWVEGIGFCFVSVVNYRTLNALIRSGLIDTRKQNIFTPAGREYLAALEGETPCSGS